MDQAAQAPPVHLNTMAFFPDDLGGQILGCAANSLGFLLGRL